MASDKPNLHFQDNMKSGAAESSIDLIKIVDEFHCLYNEKLRKLEMSGDASPDVKICVLEEWLRDVTEQNRMLIKTVEHLEKNALERVDTLDCVLRSAEDKQIYEPCKGCPELNDRLETVVCELECARKSIIEKESVLRECMKQNDELKKALCAQSNSNQASKKAQECNSAELERTVVELRNHLCRNEKLLKARTEEIEYLKMNFVDQDKMSQMLKSDADKSRCLGQMQEAIAILKEAVKEKDCILENYYQEIAYLKEKLDLAKEQGCRILQLEDSLKYYQQSLKQKDLMLEKLKDHIKQLRQCLAQFQCQQDMEKVSRSSFTEEYYVGGDMSGFVSYRTDDAVLAAGDSELVDELRKKLANEKDMQVALTSEIAEKHDAIMRMKEVVKELEEQLRQSDMQTHFKDDIIRQLRKEVKLGRAKESLAEMLGLKGGPRAQMKAKIDHLHSELEEREIEISRLEGKLEASRLPTVEAKLNRLEVEIVDRERSVLALCDKLDYVRKYLAKLRGSEEDISVKCGLEALLLELSEDIEWTRETRRNVSIPLNEDPNESVIIINHRSHSLPDTTLQQVQSLKMNSENGALPETDSPSLKDLTECLSLKEQINSLESNLCETLSQLTLIWESMKKCELECGDSTSKLTQEVLNTIENEHSQLLRVNNEMQNIAEQINEYTTLGVNNDYLMHCIEECLIGSLEMLNKQKILMGVTETSSNSIINDTEVPPNVKYIKNAEDGLSDSISLLQQLKSKLLPFNATKSDLNANKTKEINNVVNNLISNKQIVLDKLCFVHLSLEDVAKRIFKRFSDFDKTFTLHHDVVKGLKFVLNNFVFNDFIGKSGKQNIFTLRSPDGKSTTNVPFLKGIDAIAAECSENENKKIKCLRKSRLSRSSPSIGEEYQSDVLEDLHMKSAHLQQVALGLNEELKSYLKEVFLREDKVRRFVCESQELNKTLDNLSKELCSSEKVLIENKASLPVQTLQVTIGQAQTEVELLLCKTDDFTTYKEMYDMNRSKIEQEIQGLQKDLFTIVSDIMDAIKTSQDYDNNLINSYRNKIQNYREKVEKLEKHLTNSIDQSEVEEKEDDDQDLICKLTDKIEKYQSEVEELQNSITVVKKDKEAVEIENQKVMEELQAKICSLQAALQSATEQNHPHPKEIIARLGSIINHQEEKIIKMQSYIKKLNEEYLNKVNLTKDGSEQEIELLKDILKKNKIDIHLLKSQVLALQKIKEQLEDCIRKNGVGPNNELKLFQMENIRIKKELEHVLGLNINYNKDIECLREELKQVQDESHRLRSQAVQQKKHIVCLIEENKEFKIAKECLENEKDQLQYEMTTLREELDAVKENECKIAAEMIKNSQRICQLVHDKENLDKIIDDKARSILSMETVVRELTKESERLKSENIKIIQQKDVVQILTNKVHSLNKLIQEKDNRLELLEQRLKSSAIKTIDEEDNGVEKSDVNIATLEESINNLEEENVRLSNENLRLKNEINLLCNFNKDSSLNTTDEIDEKQYTTLINKISMYRNKLKVFMQQNWRLIEMVNKLQHINNMLINDKENNKLKRYLNKDNVMDKYYENQLSGGGEMAVYKY